MSVDQLPPAPTTDGQVAAPMDTKPRPPAEPPSPRKRQPSPAVIALVLIALGLVLLVGNVVPLGGGAAILGLGLGFLAARIVTGRYGFAVPAGLLLGLGAFVTWQETAFGFAPFRPMDEDGWALTLLGLGFGAIYVIGARPRAIWPLFPAAVLLALGVGTLNLVDLQPLAQLAWVGSYWPLALVLVGAWLLVRHALPIRWRQVIAIAGAITILAYGAFAAAATAAAAHGGIDLGGAGFLGPGVGAYTLPYTATEERTVTISPTGTVRVSNPNGTTTIRGGTGTDVHVTATEHYGTTSAPPQFTLTSDGADATLQTGIGTVFPFGMVPRVDFVVDVPATAGVAADSASGALSITGVNGPVTASASSGAITLSNLGGPVVVNTSSGGQRLTDIAGDVTARSSSGTIEATGIAQPREVATSSGQILIAGTFAGATHIRSSSGNVTIRLDPASATQVSVSTGSGTTTVRGLIMGGQQSTRHSLTGTIGSGTGRLEIQTASGNVLLMPAAR